MLRLILITQLSIWCFTLSLITQQGLESSDGRSSNAKSSADKPNVLFIAVDDLRPVYRYIQWQKDPAEGEILFRELYDHSSGPDETNNLEAREPKVIKHFEKMLKELLD